MSSVDLSKCILIGGAGGLRWGVPRTIPKGPPADNRQNNRDGRFGVVNTPHEHPGPDQVLTYAQDDAALRSMAVRSLNGDENGQAVAEFSLVVVLLVTILFAILETGLLLNDKMVLTSTAREVARVCAVEGGRTPNALSRLNELLSSAGFDISSVTSSIAPGQAIYGTTITVELGYSYRVKSPVIGSIVGHTIGLTAKAVTRSEFVPR
ncbi:MAG: TadE family protein [Bacillota bacterium]